MNNMRLQRALAFILRVVLSMNELFQKFDVFHPLTLERLILLSIHGNKVQQRKVFETPKSAL